MGKTYFPYGFTYSHRAGEMRQIILLHRYLVG